MKERAEGFPPVFDQNSRVLVLGSFPSVKSRAQGFYYGNPQNRFWRTVCGFFGGGVAAGAQRNFFGGNMLTYNAVLARLTENADEAYRAFHLKLLKNGAIAVIGVRMPVLRKLAAEWKNELSLLMTFPDEYYEVTFLKCAAAALLPFAQFLSYVERLVPLLDNWATCDCFHNRKIAAHKEEFLPYILRFFGDGREFVQRYALVALLHDYVEEKYLPLIGRLVKEVPEDAPYYVTTAAAWLAAEVVVRFYGEGVKLLGRLSPGVARLAVRKARESFRLSPEQKEGLKPFGKTKEFSQKG